MFCLCIHSNKTFPPQPVSIPQMAALVASYSFFGNSIKLRQGIPWLLHFRHSQLLNSLSQSSFRWPMTVFERIQYSGHRTQSSLFVFSFVSQFIKILTKVILTPVSLLSHPIPPTPHNTQVIAKNYTHSML